MFVASVRSMYRYENTFLNNGTGVLKAYIFGCPTNIGPIKYVSNINEARNFQWRWNLYFEESFNWELNGNSIKITLPEFSFEMVFETNANGTLQINDSGLLFYK